MSVHNSSMNESIVSFYTKALKLNISKDTFEVIKYDDEETASLIHSCKTITEFFTKIAELECVYPDDANDFMHYTSIDYLRRFFTSEHKDNIHRIQYRRLEKGEYRWVIMEMIAAEDYTEDNKLLYMTVKDIHESLMFEESNLQDVFRALCDDFDSIFFINTDTQKLISYRVNGHGDDDFKNYLKSEPNYDDAMKRYISSVVLPEDRARLSRAADISSVIEKLRFREAISVEYRTLYDGKVHWYRMKFAKIDSFGKPTRLAMGLADICEQKRTETDFYKNGKSVLLVDSDTENRTQLAEILKGYTVIQASNGNEAISILKMKHEDVAVVITAVNMPVCDGYELIQKMQRTHNMRSIPVLVVSDGTDEEMESRCYGFGAFDRVLKPFNPTVIRNRVQLFIKYRESVNMLNTLEKDALTGLFNKEFFFRNVESIIANNPEKKYMIMVSDIENFKFINEQYGTDMGDQVLREIAGRGSSDIPGYIIGGRIEGDRFVTLVDDAPMEVIQESLKKAPQKDVPVKNLTIKHGIYHIRKNISVSSMCDRAIFALNSIKGVYGKNIAEYNDEIRRDMLLRQLIIDSSHDAIETKQFKVFYQPKHDLRTDRTGGAEALVRWIHPELGFMNPNSFISLFEQSGFISILDKYVLTNVCADINEWKRRKLPIVPISINISRRDFEKDDLADSIISIVDSYKVEHELIHIELTESAYSTNPDIIERTIRKLHDNGFVIELDDFGSGYSSMEALNRLDLDIMKLDMGIVKNDVPGSEKNVLEFAMQLAKTLKLQTVAEGVETIAQADRMKSLDVDYNQGYYYSKPLPKEEFEEYLTR